MTEKNTCRFIRVNWGCGWLGEHYKVRKPCDPLMRLRKCPLLRHRTEAEWAHLPKDLVEKVLNGQYPAARILRWERLVNDLLRFVVLDVDPKWGPKDVKVNWQEVRIGGYHSFHEALGILREEYKEFEDEVFKMEDSAHGRVPTDVLASAAAELRDVAAVSLMTLYHLTPYMEEVEE